jgi:hypothetical protein
MRRGEAAEGDEMWSLVQNKGPPRWLWPALDHLSGVVLAYAFGSRAEEVFVAVQKLLKPFYWSAELPPDTAHRCPIPKWSTRETHIVLRSGTTGLGHWVQEERNLYADYQRWVGEPPARILRVWLIALGMFQPGEGQGE